MANEIDTAANLVWPLRGIAVILFSILLIIAVGSTGGPYAFFAVALAVFGVGLTFRS